MPPDSTQSSNQSEKLNNPTHHQQNRNLKVRSRDRYSTILLVAMSVIALISGIVAFWFGQVTLEGVRQIPADGRLPRMNINEMKPAKN